MTTTEIAWPSSRLASASTPTGATVPSASPSSRATAGAAIALALGGAIFTETVYGLPGLGQTAIQSITNYDLPITQGVVVFGTVCVLVVNLVVDLFYAVVDPRIRLN